MKILKYSLGQLQANCYLLIKDNNCLIIDPGDEAQFILEQLLRNKLNLIGIMATHGHFDHVMAIGEIQLSINAPIYFNFKDQFLIDRTRETAEHFLGCKPVVMPIINRNNLDNKNSLIIGDFKMKIIHTPGHTPGGISIYFPDDHLVFTGDTLFKDGIGRYDFSYCSKSDLKRSLATLLNLPRETRVYPGHGEETTINDEKNNLVDFLA